MTTPESTPPATPPPAQGVTPAAVPTVKSSQEYFNSSRLKVIGMITAATVAVGALGGIAGVAFDPDPVPKDHVIQPGSSDTPRLGAQSLDSGPGNVSPHAGAARSPFTSRVPTADTTASPSSVGTVSPGSGGLPTDGSSTDAPAPSTGGDTGVTDGSGATIEATGVDVFVPPNWTVDQQDENRVFQSDGQGSFSFAFSYADDPSTAAGDILTQNLDNLLPPENYTQRQTSDVTALDPFGSVVSIAGIEYDALWVDNQGSVSIHGQIYVGVRQDGTVLGILIEHVPAEDFESVFDDLTPILDESFSRFAGV